jgi:hypothetical protein
MKLLLVAAMCVATAAAAERKYLMDDPAFWDSAREVARNRSLAAGLTDDPGRGWVGAWVFHVLRSPPPAFLMIPRACRC